MAFSPSFSGLNCGAVVCDVLIRAMRIGLMERNNDN